jgi:thymidylate synthase
VGRPQGRPCRECPTRVVGAFVEPDRSPPRVAAVLAGELHMMAAQAGLAVGEFVWTGGDCHIYDNHVEQVTEQLRREARSYPKLVLAHRDSIFDYVYGDIVVEDYRPHPAIKAPVAV